MPRPSLKAQRSEEILDAYERCVARYGVEGATLEKNRWRKLDYNVVY